MSRFLVTGGAGFIGSRIVKTLLNCGDNVRVLDNFSTGEKDALLHEKKISEIVKGDIRDLSCVVRAAKGVDCIIHEAAIASVGKAMEDPVFCDEVNLTGTLNSLIAAKEAGVKRFIFASSCAVYGEGKTSPKRENDTPSPLSLYGVQKLCGEFYCKVFGKEFGLEVVILRYFNVFGPGQKAGSSYAAVIPIFLDKMLREERPVIFGDGKQTRDFIYVDDIARATVKAAKIKRASGKTFNIGTGRRVSLNRLVCIMNKVLGTQIEPIYTSERQGDIKHSLADISLAKRILNFRARVSFEEGLAKTAEYFKRYNSFRVTLRK